MPDGGGVSDAMNQRSVIDSTRQFVVFPIEKSEFLDHLHDVFGVRKYDNPGARVMFLALHAVFASELQTRK